jgi:hypothetical protein
MQFNEGLYFFICFFFLFAQFFIFLNFLKTWQYNKFFGWISGIFLDFSFFLNSHAPLILDASLLNHSLRILEKSPLDALTKRKNVDETADKLEVFEVYDDTELGGDSKYPERKN